MGNDPPPVCQVHAINHFNPRSRVGNDLSLILPFLFNFISIHVPAWGTTCCSFSISPLTLFQSTFPRGERPHLIFDNYSYIGFQSTFPRGERLIFIKPQEVIKKFQSTFPRGERPMLSLLSCDRNAISIHVPAWGTTILNVMIRLGILYFNPRSRVGNDAISKSVIVPTCEFQSTFPRGERRSGCLLSTLTNRISIHVPAWGTTYFCIDFRKEKRNFNPRSRVGNDRWLPYRQQRAQISIHVSAWGTTGRHSRP